MGKVRDQLAEVRFHCQECGLRFEAAPARLEDAPQDEWHPWRYFAPCPDCGAESPQEKQQRHLLKCWARATGPKTAEGKARSAANLDGHPTPEEALRTRFNALKHGMEARVATYFPARPGQYSQCRGCEYFATCHTYTACQKRTELFLRHDIAFKGGDPRLLTDLRAALHANLQALMDDMLLAIVQDGVRLKSPQWYYDNDGHFHLAAYIDERSGQKEVIYDITAHPLLKLLIEYTSKLGLTLTDLGMTPKGQEDGETLRGHLDSQGQRQETLLEYQRQQAAALTQLGTLLERSRQQAEKDPVLVEYQRGGGET